MTETEDLPRNSLPVGRSMPHSVEAEEYLLSCCLLDGAEVISRCMEARIRKESFFTEAHGIIFERLMDLYNRQVPIDVGVLAEDLRTVKQLDAIGGYAFLTQVSSRIPTTAQAGFYIEKVREQSLLRDIIRAGTGTVESCYEFSGGIDEFVDQVEQRIFAVTQTRVSESAKQMREPTQEAMKVITKMMMKKGELTGVATGFKDLDALTWGFQRQEMIILAARPSMGKCLAHDAEIVLADGSIGTIQELFKRRDARVLTLGNDLKLGLTSPSDFVDDGIKPVYRVTTRLGRVVEATAPHPFLTIDGWKPLMELKQGSAIAVPREIPVFGTEARTDAQIKLTAYLLGDGTLTQSSILFTNGNRRIRAEFASAISEFGGCVVREFDSRGTRTETIRVSTDRVGVVSARHHLASELRVALKSRNMTQKRLSELAAVSPGAVSGWIKGNVVPSPRAWPAVADILEKPSGHSFAEASKNQPNRLSRWIRELGLHGKRAQTKFIPEFVFKLPRPQLAIFINRLFSTDGWASVSSTSACQIGFCSTSERMLRQVAHLLLRFGVVGAIKKRLITYKKAKRPCSVLIVTERESILRFCREISIFGKEEAIVRVAETILSKNPQTNNDLIPDSIWGRIAVTKGDEPWSSLARRAGIAGSSNVHVGRRGISRRRLSKFAEAVSEQSLKDLANSQVFWDEIVSIEAAGNKQVYDLTIPETHNFVANDICVHNTSLALNFAEGAAMPRKGDAHGVLIFSLEMSAAQLAMRMLCSRARVNMKLLRDGLLSKNGDEQQRMVQTADEYAKAPIFIDDSSNLSIMQLRAKARRLHARHKLGFIVVDYLQLLSPTDPKVPREQQVAEASRGLKALAKELDLPVLVLSQLNRSSEKENRTPKLADLRESGSIEQDADVVLMLARPKDADEKFQVAADSAELIVAKQRNGPVGDLKLTFLRDITRFENYTQ